MTAAIFARIAFAVAVAYCESGDFALGIISGTFGTCDDFVAIADNLFKRIAAIIAFIVINRHNKLFQSYLY